MLTNNIDQEAMNTERRLGSACSKSSGYRFLHSIEKKHSKMIENAIDKAIKNKNLIVASIDDYSVVRSIQRPTGEQISHAVYMCAIIFRVFEDISAISWKSPTELNNPDGITSIYCVEAITSLESMHELCQTCFCYARMAT